MATVDLGRIKFVWKGAYSGATAYVADDVVESSGSTYVCIAATTGNAPPNATYWELMSQKGVDADLLTISGTVQGDIYYNNGSAIARLAPGTSGQFLQTQGSSANPQWSDAGGGYKQMVETVYTTANKVSPGTSATDVVAPSTLGDGSFGVTIQDANSVLFVNAAIQSGHEDTWNQQFSRVQYKIGSGGSWTHLCGFGSAMHASGTNIINPSIFIQDILDHNQTVGTTIYFRIISNFSYSGSYIWWNRQDPSDSAASNTNEGGYSQSFIRIIEMA